MRLNIDGGRMRYPALEYLLTNYFHQDLYELYGDEWAAVAAFVQDDRATAVSVPTDVEHVLRTRTTEESLRDYVDATYCEFVPGPEDGGYRGWLEEIARRIRLAINESGGGHP